MTQPKFDGLIKRYKKLLHQADVIEKAGKSFETRKDDEGEFIYLAHVRAAEAVRQRADALIDQGADRLQ